MLGCGLFGLGQFPVNGECSLGEAQMVLTEPPPEAYSMLGTQLGRAVLDAIPVAYNTFPVGTDTDAAIIQKAAASFIQHFGVRWRAARKAETRDAVLNDPCFHEIMRAVHALRLKPSVKNVAVDASKLADNDLLALINRMFATSTDAFKQYKYMEFLTKKQRGQPIQVPAVIVEEHGLPRWIPWLAIGIGVLAVGWFLMRKPKPARLPFDGDVIDVTPVRV